jgi:hypothetical protein
VKLPATPGIHEGRIVFAAPPAEEFRFGAVPEDLAVEDDSVAVEEDRLGRHGGT